MSEVIDVTDATFAAEVLRSDKPTLVDYWADWCSPCKQLSPIIEELAQEYAGRIKFCKLDTNANPAVPAERGILALPTLQLYVDGEVVQSLQGGKTKRALIKLLDDVL